MRNSAAQGRPGLRHWRIADMVSSNHRMRGSVLIVLSCLCAVAARGNEKKNYSEKIKDARQAVVEVLVAGQRQGTGFCVSPNGYIVTATHVVGSTEINLG